MADIGGYWLKAIDQTIIDPFCAESMVSNRQAQDFQAEAKAALGLADDCFAIFARQLHQAEDRVLGEEVPVPFMPTALGIVPSANGHMGLFYGATLTMGPVQMLVIRLKMVDTFPLRPWMWTLLMTGSMLVSWSHEPVNS